MMLSYFALFFVAVSMVSVHAQGPNPTTIPVSPEDVGRYSMRASLDECPEPKFERGLDHCNQTQRMYSGFCTNAKLPFHGVVDSDQFTYFPTSDYNECGGCAAFPLDLEGLASTRDISEIVSVQTNLNGDVPNKHGLTDFVTFFAQFLDHNLFHTGMDMESDMPIPMQPFDIMSNNFTNGEIPFKRSKKTCVNSRFGTIGMPLNCLSSPIDLAGVYGFKSMDVNALRAPKNGRMKVKKRRVPTKGREIFLPRISRKTNREMTLPRPTDLPEGKELPLKFRKQFFAAGDQRANENIVLSAIHTLFVREHNRLVKKLRKAVPRSKLSRDKKERDEELFQLAKRLNEAQFQAIVVKEFFREMTGRDLPEIVHDDSQSPKVSNVFSTAAFRVGHTMVGNNVQLRDADGKVKTELPVTHLFFKPASLLESNGLDDVFRGVVWRRAQEIDPLVVHALKGHLFVNVLGERANQDLVALNLQRGRDHNLPSFVDIRNFFGLGRVSSWDDITTDLNTKARLDSAYGNFNQVEAWVGMVAEDHAPNSPMGPTLNKVWEIEFTRILRADRFFYKRTDSYDKRIKDYMTAEWSDIVNDRRKMKDIILDNTGITSAQLPRNIWRMTS